MDDAAPIFVSYRRSDAAGHARALYEYLSGRIGVDQIFFDRSTIEGGDVFPDALRRGVEGCVALIALIAPDWLNVGGADGGRRLDDPGDFVRQEIALALERGKKVIPVLFDDASVPSANSLPEPLKMLASCDALTLRGKTYEYITQRRELVRLLAKVPGVPEPLPEAGETFAGGIVQQLPAIVEAATRGFQELNDAQRETIRTLERQLGANEVQLAAFFQVIGEAHVPPDQQPTRLIEIAAQWRQLHAQIAIEPGDAPEVAKLKHAARAALDAGLLQEADDLLAQVETAQDTALNRQQREVERQQMERAATAAQRGGVALTRLRYREAAQHFAVAAERVPQGRDDHEFAYLDQEFLAPHRQGTEFGDKTALVDAIARCRALLDRRDRELVPLDWAMTQNNLGGALTRLGERETDTGPLEEAVAAYRAALEEWARERVPMQWAMAQSNLGSALQALGKRESDTARLIAAVTSFRAALEEYTRARVPLQWAMTQDNLSNALRALGERKSDTKRLEEAVLAHRAALEEWTRKRVPLHWARAQHNLGNALQALGRRESGTARLEEAVAAYRAALEEGTRERVPLDWAMTQDNLGNVLQALGERESSTKRLQEAVAAHRSALEEWKRGQRPSTTSESCFRRWESGSKIRGIWKRRWRLTTQRSKRERASGRPWIGRRRRTVSATPCRALGAHQSGTKRLEKAVTAYRAALEERTRERVPLDWAATQYNLATALGRLGERESGTAHLGEAVAAYRAALKERTRERVPLDWAATQNNLGSALSSPGSALSSLGMRENDTGCLEEAVAAFGAALEGYPRERAPLGWAMTQNNLGSALHG